jgi:hypothetical protein
LLNIRLPFSDRARECLMRLLGILYATLFIPMIGLNQSFYRSGALTPDVATGRTFPVNEHGVLYVVPWQGELAFWLFWSCGVMIALLVLVNPYHGRLFLLRDE